MEHTRRAVAAACAPRAAEAGQPAIGRVIRSRRRSVELNITPEGELIVRAPYGMPRAAVEEVVRQKADWVERMRARMAARRAQLVQHTYLEGDCFPVLGVPHTLHIRPGARGVFREGGALVAPPLPPERMRAALEGWYRDCARAVFSERMRYWADCMGVAYTALRLSGAQARWGSCNGKGGVNLVWRLVMAPPEVLDYVIVHELCHIPHPDHSRAFWAMVAQYCPQWQERRAWLRENGQGLVL